jgi:hypothetical protein
MTEPKVYKIRGSLLLPLAVIVLCLLALSISAWVTTAGWGERIFLTILTAAAGFFLVERRTRHLVITPEGLTVAKFFRKKQVGWDEITELSALTLGRKQYLILTTIKGFLFFSNSWAGLFRLAQEISSQLDPQRIDRESLDKQEAPDSFPWQAAYFWSAAVLVILLTVFRLQPTLP